ncbi:hydrogenase [Deferribacteraceae bacterium V6Fe1]|nr:hydrogenase [Deferribacteraceae bacterium V6Fe1]
MTQKIKNQGILVSLFTAIFTYVFIVGVFPGYNFNIRINTFFCQASGQIDGLSKFFLIPLSIISVCAFLYSFYYFPESGHKKEWTITSIFFPLMTFAMVMIVLAKNLIMLLIFWEIMAVSAFFLLITEHKHHEVRDAAKLYIILTHFCTFLIFVASILIYKYTGSFDFPKAGSLDANTTLGIGIFIFTLLGFGIKAGILPLHIWLPSAHANAPSSVSAIMSGLMIKMGVYGIIRFLSFFNNPPLYWGLIIFAAGITSGIIGVVLAIGQHDIKRLLAYHSIENIGIILMGFGLGLAGMSTGNDIAMVLGFTGSIFHILNHATFKSLLFLGAGAIINASGTRQMDEMGGLGKKIPFTFGTFLIASASISGLPPFNGFVSELFIYLGMFAIISKSSLLPLNFLQLMGIPALALIGGLASACFLKVNSAVFMGSNPNLQNTPQSKFQEPFSLKISLGIPALICVSLGIFPYILKSPLEDAIYTITGHHFDLIRYFPFKELSMFIAIFYVLLIFGLLVFKLIFKNKIEYAEETWGCGYIKPNHKFRYTATSFAEIISGIFNFILNTHFHRKEVRGIFPERVYFKSHVPDVFLDNTILPFFKFLGNILSPIRKLQAGNLNLYLLYKLIAIVSLVIYGVILIW